MSRTLNSTTGLYEWTASPSTRQVYVWFAGGNDANSGLDSAHPVKTWAKVLTLIRQGFPDWVSILDDEVVGSFGEFERSGVSADEPMRIIGAGTVTGKTVFKIGSNNGVTYQGSGGPTCKGLTFENIDFYCHTRDPASPDYNASEGANLPMPIRWLGQTDSLVFQNCRISWGWQNIIIQAYYGPHVEVIFNRCESYDAYTTADAHAEGMYVDGPSQLTMTECKFDHNGWSETISGAVETIFRHNVYLQATTINATVRGCAFSRASSHGLKLRGGGTASHNLFIQNAIHIEVGQYNGGHVTPGGVVCHVEDNAIIWSKGIGTYGPRGWVADLNNIKAGQSATFSRNILSTDQQNAFPALSVNGGYTAVNPADEVGVNDLTIADNICWKWHSFAGISYLNATGFRSLSGVVFSGNDVQQCLTAPFITQGFAVDSSKASYSSNRYYGTQPNSSWFNLNGAVTTFAAWQAANEASAQNTQVTYSDPDRTPATYAGAIGQGSTLASLWTYWKARPAGTWNASYAIEARYTGGNDAALEYFEAGFDVGTGGGDTIPPTISNVSASPSGTSATITWTTNETASSQVEYGLTTSYGSSTTLDPTLVTSHSVNLSGLDPATTYHYRVKSADASSNLAISGDHTFATTDTVAPVISNVSATANSSSATILWDTNEAATSQVEYGPDTLYGSNTTLDPLLVTAHSVALSALAPSSTYHFRAKSKDAANNEGVSIDYNFTTPAAPVSGGGKVKRPGRFRFA